MNFLNNVLFGGNNDITNIKLLPTENNNYLMTPENQKNS